MKFLFFETIDSTNTWLRDHHDELEDMTFLSAAYQNDGKGRSGRKWSSDRGKNLMLSFLVKDERVLEEYRALSVLCAYSVICVLKEYGIDDLSIKWPNDVYAQGKKICGILLEGISHEKLDCLICGIGINVNQETFDDEMVHEPVSMKMLLSQDTDIGELKEKVCQELTGNIEELKNGHDFYDEIAVYDHLKGKDVYALIGNEKRKVRVSGMNRDFSLKVLDGDGSMDLSSSEISFHI